MGKPKFLTLLFLGGLFFLFLLPPTDPDLGWQLRCGQEIWKQGKLCSQNTFSVFLENFYWTDARTLYQLLIFPFYQLFGLFGLSLVNSLLILASSILFLSLSGRSEVKITTFPLWIFFSWPVLGFGIRNQLLSLFFLLILLKLIELAYKDQKWFLLLPAVILLWANSHGGFVLGVILLLIFLFEKTIWLIIAHQNFRNYLLILGIILGSIGVTFLNPFGLKIYQEAWRHFAVVPLSHLIAEWVPPHFWFQITILLVLAAALWAIYLTKKQPLTITKFLFLIALAFLALKARRDLVFFFFFAIYVFSSLKIRGKNFYPLALLSSLSIFTFGFFFQLPRTVMIDSNWLRFCQSGQVSYPCQAVEFLKTQLEKGNIFNRYEWGGFLIWQLPEYKIFVDGRMPAWPTPSGKSPYTIYLETLQTQPGWQETLKEYNINWILISPGTFMDLLLRPVPEKFGWQEVYRDKISVVYKRKILLVE